MDMAQGTGKQGEYLSFLLRMWRDSDDGTPSPRDQLWRASLQSPLTGDLVGFASLEDLFDFLREQAGLVSSTKGTPNEV